MVHRNAAKLLCVVSLVVIAVLIIILVLLIVILKWYDYPIPSFLSILTNCRYRKEIPNFLFFFQSSDGVWVQGSLKYCYRKYRSVDLLFFLNEKMVCFSCPFINVCPYLNTVSVSVSVSFIIEFPLFRLT